MANLNNDRLLRALTFQPVDRTPVWIMRQAGRYLPEYRAVRAKVKDFMTLCKTPELACEVTLQPLARFPLDAAIIFSDILTIPDAMGLGLGFTEGQGPYFERPLRDKKAINRLTIPDVEQDLGYVCEAIMMVCHELNGKVPLLGFAGSPWTLATYMVEGGPSKTFSIIKKMLFCEPLLLHQLLGLLADTLVAYLNAQIAAGVNAVMLFDTWGGVLSPWDYKEFSLNYMEHVISGLVCDEEKVVPVILFTKGGGSTFLEMMVDAGCDAIGVDWSLSLADARERVNGKVALQGNMDPSVLYASPNRIREEVNTILASYGFGSGHVFNLGHGIAQDTPIEHVAAFVDAVHEFSGNYHQRT